MITTDRDQVIKRLQLSPAAVEKLDRYVELLEAEQTKMNLVGPSTLPAVWTRHILDSAQLFSLFLPSDHVILDLGSGAGFPALVLAAMDTDRKYVFHLVESDGKKSAFLNKVIKICDLNAEVHNQRIEQMKLLNVDLVTARALAPLDKLIKYAFPFLQTKVRCLFMKGVKAEEELTQALKKYRFNVQKIQSISSDEGTILLLSGVKKK
ncbi:MAG: 16S rRNA (guanine(527)-N(7))-methyltransferase RsmG [Alphaproteobacteria bacterium]|nr:16S rRNA (guanine(527)-N(7))-methyltransferase RsmG [Alphaproteobacteria bacterium]